MPGRTRWTDFTAGEIVELSGFGYASPAAAAADFTQSGADVVFARGAVTVRFLNANLSAVVQGIVLDQNGVVNPPTGTNSLSTVRLSKS